MENILLYIRDVSVSTFDILLDASLYLLIGFVVAGLLKAFVRADQIIRHIGEPTFSSVFKASLLGTPLPLCSCSVIPVATSLRQNGASKGATMSFLISTPESGVDSIAVSYAMLDPLMTVFRPFAAFVTGFASGALENLGSRNGEACARPAPLPIRTDHDTCDCDCETVQTEAASKSALRRLKEGMTYAFTDLVGDVAYYLVIGLAISGLITALVPAGFFHRYLTSDLTVMLLMLVLGIPMYVCASASTPIAAALILKGASPGAALVFLLVGPATNLATIGVVRKFLGLRSFWIYLTTISVAALLLGLLLNFIYRSFDLPMDVRMGSGSEWLPPWVRYVSALILFPFLIRGIRREISHRFLHKS